MTVIPAAFTDAAGTSHAMAGPAPRLVSLVPSLTELLFDLGLGASVVGRTHYCCHPQPAVAALPSVGGTKKIRFDRLLALEPSHVLVNVDETPRSLARRIEEAGIAVVVTHPIEPRDNIALYRLVGGLFGRMDEAERLVARFEAAHAALIAAAAGWPDRRVLLLIWQRPWMTVSRDTYVSRMLALARLETAGHDPAARYPTLALDQALLDQVDAVLFMTEPYRFAEADIRSFCDDFPGARVTCRLVDGELLSWYGSRAVPALDHLRQLGEALRRAP